jgi:hypothetical protein
MPVVHQDSTTTTNKKLLAPEGPPFPAPYSLFPVPCSLSSVFCLLSPVFCLLSSVFCLLSFCRCQTAPFCGQLWPLFASFLLLQHDTSAQSLPPQAYDFASRTHLAQFVRFFPDDSAQYVPFNPQSKKYICPFAPSRVLAFFADLPTRDPLTC